MSKFALSLSVMLSMLGCHSAAPVTGEGPPGTEPPVDGTIKPDAGSGRLDAGPSEVTVRDGATITTANDASSDDCVRGRYTTKARALDMFILLDQSGSMLEHDDRWHPVTNALEAFVDTANLTRTGVALQYFPVGPSDEIKCQSATYATPDVAMADLPGNAALIHSSIEAHDFTKEECCDDEEHSGTPTRPAVEGAAQYVRTWLTAHPDHVGVILLATDGEPSSVCDDNEVEDVATVLEAAAAGTPAVKTYVIGIGDNDSLDEMAVAGGTGEGALIVDGTGKQTEEQLRSALSRIREEALPCDYPLDTVEAADRVNVTWTVESSGASTTLVNVTSAEQCARAAATGWYYDDPKKPTRITLCPEACRALPRDPGVTVQIVDGCKTMVLL